MDISLSFQELRKYLGELQNVTQCKFHIYFKVISSEIEFQWNASDVIPSASTIKLPILLASLQRYYGDPSIKTKLFSIKDNWDSSGTGVLRYLSKDNKLPLMDLNTLMIIISDNVASNTIIDYLGFDVINETVQRFKLSKTKLFRKFDGFRFYEINKHAEAADNMTTAKEMGLLLEKIYLNSLNRDKICKKAIEILKHQQVKDRIPRYLPESVTALCKSGDYPDGYHDIGIIEPANFYPYVLSAFSTNCKSKDIAVENIANISQFIYQQLAEKG